MNLQLSYQLAQMLQNAADLGAQRALTLVGELKPYIKKEEAYKMYGKTAVDRWISEGVVKLRQDEPGKHYRIDRVQIASVAMSQNLVQYLSIQKKQP